MVYIIPTPHTIYWGDTNENLFCKIGNWQHRRSVQWAIIAAFFDRCPAGRGAGSLFQPGQQPVFRYCRQVSIGTSPWGRFFHRIGCSGQVPVAAVPAQFPELGSHVCAACVWNRGDLLRRGCVQSGDEHGSPWNRGGFFAADVSVSCDFALWVSAGMLVRGTQSQFSGILWQASGDSGVDLWHFAAVCIFGILPGTVAGRYVLFEVRSIGYGHILSCVYAVPDR